MNVKVKTTLVSLDVENYIDGICLSMIEAVVKEAVKLHNAVAEKSQSNERTD